MEILIIWILLSLLGLMTLFFILCLTAFNRYKKKYEVMPLGLKALISNYPQKRYNENKYLQDYAKNKILNANIKIEYYKKIILYCELEIKGIISKINK